MPTAGKQQVYRLFRKCGWFVALTAVSIVNSNKMKSKTYHIGLWNYAAHFFRAAEKLQDEKEAGIDIPIYFLYGHAIELVLKALLSYHGYDEQKLITIRHDLDKAWKKAEDHGLSNYLANVEDVEKTIGSFNHYYKTKQFEYLYPGFKRYPRIDQMHEVTRLLLYAIGQAIKIPKVHLNKWIS